MEDGRTDGRGRKKRARAPHASHEHARARVHVHVAALGRHNSRFTNDRLPFHAKWDSAVWEDRLGRRSEVYWVEHSSCILQL